mmetsp:Transcript_31527/g.77281  ORF Transcript_31527/g.77281 Transcript_31527/m.77281 type:complete len:205 (-) Transcript_31527:158-772(-)
MVRPNTAPALLMELARACAASVARESCACTMPAPKPARTLSCESVARRAAAFCWCSEAIRLCCWCVLLMPVGVDRPLSVRASEILLEIGEHGTSSAPLDLAVISMLPLPQIGRTTDPDARMLLYTGVPGPASAVSLLETFELGPHMVLGVPQMALGVALDVADGGVGVPIAESVFTPPELASPPEFSSDTGIGAFGARKLQAAK